MDILQKISEIIASSEEPVIFELGMCDAYHSQIMIDILAKSGKPFEFHGFEPVKSLYRNILLKYDNNFGTVALHNMAIGSKDGLADFYISSGQKIENGQVVANYYGSSSIRAPKLVLEAWKDMKFEQDQISVITLDSYTKGRIVGDKIIDFIWADIQGAEVDMIAGGKETFKKVRYLYTEYCDAELYEGEIGLSQICKMLPDFELIYDFGGDVLLKNKKL